MSDENANTGRSSHRWTRRLLRKPMGIGVGVLVVLLVIAAAGSRLLRSYSERSFLQWSRDLRVHPLLLHVIYFDDPSRCVTTGDPYLHAGTARYVFTNQLPFRIKVAFPPISYTWGSGFCVDYTTASGSFRFAAEASDVSRMPAFCREPRLVEFAPGQARCFETPFSFSGAFPPVPTDEFIFGNPQGLEDDAIVLCCVNGTSEFRIAE